MDLAEEFRMPQRSTKEPGLHTKSKSEPASKFGGMLADSLAKVELLSDQPGHFTLEPEPLLIRRFTVVRRFAVFGRLAIFRGLAILGCLPILGSRAFLRSSLIRLSPIRRSSIRRTSLRRSGLRCAAVGLGLRPSLSAIGALAEKAVHSAAKLRLQGEIGKAVSLERR